MGQNEEIKEVIRGYLLRNLFESGSADELTDSVQLITGGILDSISTLQLVSFIEERFKIEFKPNEIDQDNLNTISRIADFVCSKMEA